MNTGVVLWSHAIYIRHLPGGIELRPGRNVVSHEQWEAVKNKPRVVSLLEAGTNGGLSVGDLRSELMSRLDSGDTVGIVNELSIEEGVAYVYSETDVARLKELQAVVRFPQVAVAINHRLGELERPTAFVRSRRSKDTE